MDDREMLELAAIRDCVSYNESTGIFLWKKSNSNVAPLGSTAGGSVNSDGYLQISIHGKRYKAHRLAWFYTYGIWPNQIDHINGNRTDNRLINLRDVTPQENSHNMANPKKNNKSGYLGVSKKNNGKYQADIRVNKKKIYLGSFNTPEEASNAYLKAKKELHKGWIDRLSVPNAVAAINKEPKP